MFRRMIVALVVALACTAGGGALASTASAANCSATFTTDGHPGYIWYNGSWEYSPLLFNCSDVYQAQVSGGYIYDYTRGAAHSAYSGGGYCTHAYPGVGACQLWFDVSVWGGGCGAPPFQVYPAYSFRVRGFNGQIPNPNFGPWHPVTGGIQWIC